LSGVRRVGLVVRSRQRAGVGDIFAAKATFDAVNWLGGEVLSSIGKPIALSKELVAALEASAKDGTLTELDVPAEDGSLDDIKFKDFGKTMMAIAKHGATVLKGALTEIDCARFEQWLKGKYLDDRASSNGKDLVMEPAMKAKMEASMLAQGMNDWPELAFPEQNKTEEDGGRPPSVGDLPLSNSTVSGRSSQAFN
jgi:hypothetical protein